MKEIIEFKDNKWYRPQMKGFIHECCDCGLQHEIDFKVVKKTNDIEIKFKRIN